MHEADIAVGFHRQRCFCVLGDSNCTKKTMSPSEEDFIRFYRDAVIAGHDGPAAETMRRFNLSRDYIVRLLNETIAGCDGQDIRNWMSGER
jgi:hypothetical protein